ncbi:MAG: hypothetical protein V4543_05605 [Bacteroidota bacterium]
MKSTPNQFSGAALRGIAAAFLILIFSAGNAAAQQVRMVSMSIDELPEAIEQQFNTTFPGAKGASWKREEEVYGKDDAVPGFYYVTFKHNKLKKQSVFDAKGKLIETVTTISRKELPLAVSNAFNNYEGQSIGRLRMIEKGRMIYFEGEFLLNFEKITCIFDSNGQIVEKVKRNALPKKISVVK